MRSRFTSAMRCSCSSICSRDCISSRPDLEVLFCCASASSRAICRWLYSISALSRSIWAQSLRSCSLQQVVVDNSQRFARGDMLAHLGNPDQAAGHLGEIAHPAC